MGQKSSKQDKLKKAMGAFVKPFSSEDIGKHPSKKELEKLFQLRSRRENINLNNHFLLEELLC